MRKARIVLAVLVVFLALAFIACEEHFGSTGSLRLTTGEDVFARTIQPSATLIQVATYRVTGHGPKGATFTVEQQLGIPNPDSTTIDIDHLLAGNWSITVEGLNSAGTVIAAKNLSVAISAG